MLGNGNNVQASDEYLRMSDVSVFLILTRFCYEVINVFSECDSSIRRTPTCIGFIACMPPVVFRDSSVACIDSISSKKVV